jgi:hypothetical protein
LGLSDGDQLLITSRVGRLEARCRIAPIARGNVQVHWPEGNVLIQRGVSDPECGIPDFSAEVQIERTD